MTYCDTNILTPFVSKNQLGDKFGGKAIRSYPNIKSFKNEKAEDKLRRLEGCKIGRKALLKDLGGHQASMGAALTSINLKNVDVVDVDGFKRGRKEFNIACSKMDFKLKKFRRSFCVNGRLKDNLKRNQIEDIRHIGSALELREKKFLTEDKELKSLNKIGRMQIK